MPTKTQNQLTHSLSLESVPIADWINEFYKAKKVENLSPKTLEAYRHALGYFLRYCEAQLLDQIPQITAGSIRNYLIWLEEQGHNPGGVHIAYRTLKTFLIWYDQEAEPEAWRNPILKVKAPKVTEEPLEPVELQIVFKMAAACDKKTFLGSRNSALLLFLLDTGLRARELLSLKTADINQVNGEILLRKGKGRKPRTVFISKDTRKALRAYLKMRTDQLPELWVTRYGKPLEYGGLRVVLEDTARAAGVQEPTAHDFRRAFALNMLRRGVDLVTLARLMGHSSLKVLQRYLKLLPDDLRDAHAKGSPVDHGDL